MAQRIKEYNMISALETIWRKAKDSQLSDKFFKSVANESAYLLLTLGLTPIQSFFVASLIDAGDAITKKKISEYAGCSNIKLMCYDEDLKELHSRWIVGWSLSGFRCKEMCYFVRPEFLAAIKENRSYQHKTFDQYNAWEAMVQIGKWFSMINENNALDDEIFPEIDNLLDKAKHLDFIQKINGYNLKKVEKMLLLIAVWKQIIEGDNCIEKSDYEDILYCSEAYFRMLNDIEDGTSKLLTDNLLEYAYDNGMADSSKLKLTRFAIDNVLGEFEYCKTKKISHKSVINPDKVAEKTLYYNEKESEQVKRLENLLSEENYNQVIARLRKSNMRPGFTCLFYGGPGTGKTETVLQLCKKTGRPVMQVDMSKLRSKWVGESERQVQELFETYKDLVHESHICPILLFNEADAIIGKRSKNADQAVEKMENTIQDIILQEMENLEGIMIATTNLTENMDSAFERRFLYKIRFDKPSVEVKSKIWKTMIPELSESDTSQLASTFDFSGGQIENIARKITVDSILYGNEVSLDSVRNLCEEENINKQNNRFVVGFKRA